MSLAIQNIWWLWATQAFMLGTRSFKHVWNRRTWGTELSICSYIGSYDKIARYNRNHSHTILQSSLYQTSADSPTHNITNVHFKLCGHKQQTWFQSFLEFCNRASNHCVILHVSRGCYLYLAVAYLSQLTSWFSRWNTLMSTWVSVRTTWWLQAS